MSKSFFENTKIWILLFIHYTYTNAIIFNDQVFIPRNGDQWAAQDADALKLFKEAFPDHNVIQIDCRDIIREAGAFHCIVMQVSVYEQ